MFLSSFAIPIKNRHLTRVGAAQLVECLNSPPTLSPEIFFKQNFIFPLTTAISTSIPARTSSNVDDTARLNFKIQNSGVLRKQGKSDPAERLRNHIPLISVTLRIYVHTLFQRCPIQLLRIYECRQP